MAENCEESDWIGHVHADRHLDNAIGGRLTLPGFTKHFSAATLSGHPEADPDVWQARFVVEYLLLDKEERL
jgi:hypothetical protein